MLKERAKEIAAFVATCDALLCGVAFLVAYAVRSRLLLTLRPDLPPTSLSHSLWLVALALPTYFLLFRKAGIYGSLRVKSIWELPILVGRPILVGGLFLGSAIFFIQAKYFSRSLFGLFLLSAYALILSEKVTIRLFQRHARRRGYNYRTVLIVGVNEGALRIADALTVQRDYGFRVVGLVSGYGQEYIQADNYKVLGSVEDLDHVLDRQIVDEIIFALPVEEIAKCEAKILKCKEIGVKVHIRADFAHSIFSKTYLSAISGIPILTLTSTPHAAGDIVLKRLVDIVISFVALVVAAPVMAIAAILVKMDSPGPVLFRQVRSGLNGRRFVLLKFRSMVYDAERQRLALEGSNEMSGPVFKVQRDPRVTRIGMILRRTSLDELPQLWNVLRGDMSLVGPRPPLPSEVRKYERWQRRRLSVKPGITCLWQVNGRSNIDFEEWMKLDMQYIDNWSLGLDLKILARTIPAVLFSRGAR